VSNTRADLIQKALEKCPTTKVVISGYSQGGQIVHNAAKQLPEDVAAKISAAIIFGDPSMCLTYHPALPARAR